jgi:hypothetical protein
VVTEILTGYGPLGVAVLALAACVGKLYRDLEKLRDKREEDVAAMTTAMAAGAASSDRIADALEELTNRLPAWISARASNRGGGPYR